MNPERLLKHFEQISEAPGALPRLRRFILDLAVRGKLVEQNQEDEPAEELLKRIETEKERLVKAGEILKEMPLSPIRDAGLPFDVPQKWRWVRLRDVASYIQRGKSPKYAAGDGPPVISQRCVQWDGLHLEWAKAITQESLERYEPIRFLQDGDLLWNSTGTGTIGRVIRVEQPTTKQLVCDSHVTIVRCLLVDERFVCIWLRSDHVYGTVEDRAAGATNQVELTAAIANNQPTPIPPIAEQHRIVGKVDELMALCDKLEEAQEKREKRRDRLVAATLHGLNNGDASPAPGTRPTFKDSTRFYLNHLPRLTTRPEHIQQLRQTILNLAVRGKLATQDLTDEPIHGILRRINEQRAELVRTKKVRHKKTDDFINLPKRDDLPDNWAVERLGNLVDPENRISYGVLVPGNDVEDGIPFVRAQDLALSSHPRRPNKTISPEVEKQYARTRLRGGEILLCVVGSIGKLGVVPSSWAGANIARAVARIMPIPDICQEYLLLVLRGQTVQTYFSEATRTLAQPTLNVGLIEQTPIPLPPIAEQQRISTKVHKLMALCDELENQLSISESGRLQLAEATLYDALPS